MVVTSRSMCDAFEGSGVAQATSPILYRKSNDTHMIPPELVTKKRIKRIAPLQLGKMLAVLYGIMGLLFLPFLLIMPFVSSQAPAEQRVGIMAFGVGFALLTPVMYAAMGFVFGALGALIYNVVAKWIGGIEVELE